MGDYEAKVISLGNDNYILEGAQNVTQVWYITKENENVALSADKQEVTYSSDLELTVVITPADTSGISLMALEPNAEDQVEFCANGNRLDVVNVTYDDNDKDSATVLIIQKVDPTYTPPIAKNLKYNGSEQELVKAGSAVGGTIEYGLAEDGSYSEKLPIGIEIGTYTVWYRVTGDNNHNDIAPLSVNVTISKDDPNTDDPEDPDDPTGPGRPTGPNNSASHDNNGTAADENDSTEDMSSSASAYADEERLGIVSAGASYVSVIIIISVTALLVFVLKRKYSGQKSGH